MTLMECKIDEICSSEQREKLLAELVNRFDRIYKTEKDCQEKINRMLYPGGEYSCRACRSNDVEHGYGERKVYCFSCKKTTSLTAYTFFHRIRNARSYLLPIWVMEQGMILNASEIGRISGVVNSTGQLILKKITYVIKNQMDTLQVELLSDQMIGVICKRSRETPKREHPSSEIREARFAAQSAVNMFSQVEDSEAPIPTGGDKNEIDLNEVETRILRLLSLRDMRLDNLIEESHLSIGQLLSGLTMLEVEGKIEIVAGDYYRKLFSCPKSIEPDSDIESSAITKKRLKKTVNFIKEIFQGIARKYLQLYNAAIWIYADRETWREDAVLGVCSNHGSVTPWMISNYVSPYIVKVVIL